METKIAKYQKGGKSSANRKATDIDNIKDEELETIFNPLCFKEPEKYLESGIRSFQLIYPNLDLYKKLELLQEKPDGLVDVKNLYQPLGPETTDSE